MTGSIRCLDRDTPPKIEHAGAKVLERCSRRVCDVDILTRAPWAGFHGVDTLTPPE